MPVSNSDLLLIQQSGTQYKVSATTLRGYMQTNLPIPVASTTVLGGIKVGTNLSITAQGVLSASIPGAIIYKGTKNFTQAPGISSPSVGHLYVNTTTGTANAGWTGFGGDDVEAGDQAIWNGSSWDLNASGSGTDGVTSVTGTSPIAVSGSSSSPVVSITAATPSSSGIGGAAGSLSAVDKEKLDGIASGAEPGTVTQVSGSTPISVSNGSTTPVVSISPATTSANGSARLADAADVSNGTTGRCVTANQLKSTNDTIAALNVGVTAISGTAPITVSGPDSNKTVAVADASTSSKGAVELATTAETQFNVTSPSTSLAVTPAGLKANYMPLDINLLQNLP